MDPMRARIIRRGADPSGRGDADLLMRSELRNLRLVIDASGGDFRIGPAGARAASLDRDEQVFLRQVIGLLEAHRSAGDFDALAILAETSIADQLDRLLPPRLREAIVWQAAHARLDLSDPALLPTHLDKPGVGRDWPG